MLFVSVVLMETRSSEEKDTCLLLGRGWGIRWMDALDTFSRGGVSVGSRNGCSCCFVDFYTEDDRRCVCTRDCADGFASDRCHADETSGKGCDE